MCSLQILTGIRGLLEVEVPEVEALTVQDMVILSH
jgi:hypothetical protein